jgi:histidinol phosphatase-like enzyme
VVFFACYHVPKKCDTAKDTIVMMHSAMQMGAPAFLEKIVT